MEEDNWKHRSTGMRCGGCMYFVLKRPGESAEPLEPGAMRRKVGRCRRHAPTMKGWPVMFITDWCGDHKLDENKL